MSGFPLRPGEWVDVPARGMRPGEWVDPATVDLASPRTTGMPLPPDTIDVGARHMRPWERLDPATVDLTAPDSRDEMVASDQHAAAGAAEDAIRLHWSLPSQPSGDPLSPDEPADTAGAERRQQLLDAWERYGS